MSNESILAQLADVLEQRKSAGAAAALAASDTSAETEATAAKAGDKEQIVHETADLWFHTLVMLAQQDLRPEQVLEELGRRFGVSGHDEKASRENSNG